MPHARPAACEGRVLTYKQLDEASDRLAVLLAQKGLKRGDKAGILVGRSENLLVYALGILKARRGICAAGQLPPAGTYSVYA